MENTMVQLVATVGNINTQLGISEARYNVFVEEAETILNALMEKEDGYMASEIFTEMFKLAQTPHEQIALGVLAGAAMSKAIRQQEAEENDPARALIALLTGQR